MAGAHEIPVYDMTRRIRVEYIILTEMLMEYEILKIYFDPTTNSRFQ